MDIVDHVLNRFAQTGIRRKPFAHTYVENVFPADFFQQIRTELPPDEAYGHHSVHDRERLIAAYPESACAQVLRSRRFAHGMFRIFGKERPANLSVELRLMRDRKGCRLKVHRDARFRMLSLVFYLPPDSSAARHGTSLYVPSENGYQRIATYPFEPNACFAVWNEDDSWHGVEPIDEDVVRDTLLYNLDDPTLPQKPWAAS